MQAQRKNAEFEVSDRITTWYAAPPEIAEIFQAWGDYIQSETLTTELHAETPPADAFVETHKIEGMEVVIGLKQN